MFKVSYNNLLACTTVHKTLEDVFEKLTESVDFEEDFNEDLNDEEVEINGVTYFKSDLLKKADPVGYRTFKADYADRVSKWIFDEIKNDLKTKGYSEQYGFTITTM